MPVMSAPTPPKPGAKRTGKRITFFSEQAMKDASQSPEEYFLQPDNPADPGQSEAASTVTSNPDGHHNLYLHSVIFSPEQSRGRHFQQTVPMKWTQPETMPQRQAAWTSSMANWPSNYANFMGDSRSQQSGFVKSSQLQPPSQNPTSSQPCSQFPDLKSQQQHGSSSSSSSSSSNIRSSSVLQPFQLAFGQPKSQNLPSYYQAFQGNGTNSGLPNPPSYQTKPTHNVLPHQNTMHQSQGAAQQLVHGQRLNLQPLQNQRVSQQCLQDFFASAQPAVVVHSHESSLPAPPKIQEPIIQDITPEPLQQTSDPLLQLQPNEPNEPVSPPLRRSRRLSKEGGAPSGDNPFLGSSSSAFPEQRSQIQNGAPTGVIQSTHRKRGAAHEVNLETLAQKASEMESLQSNFKDPHRPWSPAEEGLNAKRPRHEGLVPLVIPVSVPVRRPEPSTESREDPRLVPVWTRDLGRGDHKPSVIVTRRRSLRNSPSDNSDQNGGLSDISQDDDLKKSKRRPRPEPLFIPSPKLSAFIAQPVYSSVTPYQSHLRSPVRLADNPLSMPPYTPPPILSPVREGSGLYFSTFLSSSSTVQGLLPATPKSATRSLLSSNSFDMTPPVLTSIGEATPVSLEPRINIGSLYQAEIPELRSRTAVEQDQHKATLLWAPLKDMEDNHSYQQKVQDLMRLAYSSVFPGGGTNQELAHHCLFQCRGDVLAALSLLLLRNPIYPKSHHLSNYHYSGSDDWSAAERRQFNRGIAAHKKDFFMVQKQVCTKSVSQCVEFYYTFKKKVKVGKNGTLLYGVSDPPESQSAEDETEHKGSQRLEEDSRKWEGLADRKPEVAHTFQPTDNNAGGVTTLPSHEKLLVPRITLPPLPFPHAPHPPHPPHPPHHPPHPLVSKPRYETQPQPRKPSPNPVHKGATAAQAGEFPCKKCGRIFNKVKSRSAHMKSHAEQEKKAAAQRQREAETRERERERESARAATAALLAQRHNGTQSQTGGDSTSDETTDEEDQDDQNWH